MQRNERYNMSSNQLSSLTYSNLNVLFPIDILTHCHSRLQHRSQYYHFNLVFYNKLVPNPYNLFCYTIFNIPIFHFNLTTTFMNQ